MRQAVNYKVLFLISILISITLIGSFLFNKFNDHFIPQSTSLADEYIVQKSQVIKQLESNSTTIKEMNKAIAYCDSTISEIDRLLLPADYEELTDTYAVRRYLYTALKVKRYGSQNYNAYNNLYYETPETYLQSLCAERIRNIDTASAGAYSVFKFSLKRDIQDYRGTLQNDLKTYTDLQGSLESRKKSLEELIKQISDITSNNILIKYAIPLFAITVVILLVVPSLYKRSSVQLSIFSKGMLTELITVFLLIATILILGIGGIVKEQVLGTLLGGISVYVLQKQKGSPGNKSADNSGLPPAEQPQAPVLPPSGPVEPPAGPHE